MHVENLTLAYGADEPVVAGLSLEVPAGRMTAVVGPNGSGKSTLLRGMSRLLKPSSGRVLLDGKDIHELPARELARQLGVLPQGPVTPEGITAAELVSRGRHPHRGLFARLTPEDEPAIEDALDAVELAELRDRPVDQLSGGQQQRVLIARALASEPELLVLDEPVAGVDTASQGRFRDALVHLVREHGAAVFLVSHELGAVADDLDRVLVLRGGRLAFDGAPADLAATGVSLGVHASDLPLWLEGL